MVITHIESNIDMPGEVNQSGIHEMNHVSLIFSKSARNLLTSGQVQC